MIGINWRAIALAAAIAGSSVHAENPPRQSTLWISPPGVENGKALRAMFEHPDDWKEARGMTDVLFYTDLQFQRQFSDEELKTWFALMHQWNIKLALEVGAVKEWGRTGAKCFAAEKPIWDRLQRLGADLYAIAMDEPLICAREHIHESDEYAAEETANYIKLVREAFPNLLVGDIEAYRR